MTTFCAVTHKLASGGGGGGGGGFAESPHARSELYLSPAAAASPLPVVSPLLGSTATLHYAHLPPMLPLPTAAAAARGFGDSLGTSSRGCRRPSDIAVVSGDTTKEAESGAGGVSSGSAEQAGSAEQERVAVDAAAYSVEESGDAVVEVVASASSASAVAATAAVRHQLFIERTC